jgi:hypothetical protein
VIDTLTQEFGYSKIGALGNPYHGLLVGGKLLLPETVQIINKLGNTYLPNGRQVFWSATYNRYYLTLTSPSSFASYYVKKPGISAVVRTPEEQAWDQAHGYEWRNDAVIYGGHFYGKSLGSPDKRFLFFGTDGSRWLIDVSGITITDGNVLGGSISATRFGEFGTASETFTTPVSLSDLGQDTPTLFYSGIVDIQNDVPATRTLKATTVRVLDTTSSGNKAVLGLYDQQARSPANPSLGRWSDWDGYKYNAIALWPVGFVELSLEHNPNGSPKITASCTVLKTREEVLGTYSYSASPPSLISVGPLGTKHYGRPVINDTVLIADRILRMGYTKANSLFETTLSFSQAITGSTQYDIGAQGEVGGFTGNTTTTATITLSVGDQQKAVTYSGSSDSTTYGGPFPLSWTNIIAAEHFNSSYSSGGDYTLSYGYEGETPTVTHPSATSVSFLFTSGSSQTGVNWDRYQLPDRILATLLDASTAQVGDIAAVKFQLSLIGNKLAIHRVKAYREQDGSMNNVLYSDVHYLKSALSYNGRVDHATPDAIYQEFVSYSSSAAAYGAFNPYVETIHWPYPEPVWFV